MSKKDDSQENSQAMSQNAQAKMKDVTLEDLNKKIQELEIQDPSSLPGELPTTDQNQQKIEELKNALARAVADLSNYRRRTEEERTKWIKVAQADLLQEILPLMANLDRSLEHLPADLKNNEWAKGILHIHQDWNRLLGKLGIKKVETVGKKIDPLRHAAMTSVPGEKDMIVQEFEAGYELDGTVVLPAKVAVGNGEGIDK